MRILLRALPVIFFLGLYTTSLAQSNNSSSSPSPAADVVETQQNNGNNGGSNAEDASLITAPPLQSSGGGSSAPLTQQQIDNINQSITLLQDQLQQINDPNDPKAIKLQTTIDRLQALLNQ